MLKLLNISAVETTIKSMAGGPGFEPRLTESESAVLPLNYPPPVDWQKCAKSLSLAACRARGG